ncbi:MULTISPECIES: hypothetical protein [unclassified Rhodococcus (in: high G+C Gram-positive bacteria)]|uniref:hypothetical protein n=1 Tax=unclassified Rhodococcus (in: high G+C Gram-positive bacteria) TaxID=192944 RepID=UPI00163ADA2F|nr:MULTISPECIES: hypothetical protein [unclassified Rhodococcus (in: high G+C Gram-positive bacteria)]MBC2642428.1 hypothetical protein [Rhodococcus sp. 3A]MBC2892829.1 hypothetical protein [Rhodococcus sp. 4CII]
MESHRREHPQDPARSLIEGTHRSEVSADGLFAFDGFEEGFEVADAEAEGAVASDEFEEHGASTDGSGPAPASYTI